MKRQRKKKQKKKRHKKNEKDKETDRYKELVWIIEPLSHTW